jgi:hypothetical protein
MALGGIRKLHSTTACGGGVISILCSPSGGHAREREREMEVERGGAPGRGREGTWLVVMCLSLLLGPPLYSGEGGSTNPSTKAAKGGGQGGEAVARVGQASPHRPQNPNPSPQARA